MNEDIMTKLYEEKMRKIERYRKALNEIIQASKQPDLEEYPAGQVDYMVAIAENALKDSK